MWPGTSRAGSRRRCRRRRRALPGQWWHGGGRRPGRGRTRLLWAAARLAAYAVPLGLEPVPEVLLHPSVIERFAASAPGLSGSARRTLRTNLRFIARRVVPALAPGGCAAAPGAGQGARTARRRSPGTWRWLTRSPPLARRMRAAGLVCLGAGAGLTGADLRARPRHRRGLPLRRGRSWTCAAPGRGRCRSCPATTTSCWPRRQFAGSGLVTGGTSAVRKNITTPLTRSLAGGTGLPRLEASRLRATWLADCAAAARAWPRSCTPPGSPAPSGSATCSPPWTRPMRPPRSRCSGRRGEHPARRARGDHRQLRHRPPGRGAAADRGAPPAAARPHPAGRDAAVPGRSPARAPDPGPRRADRPARGRPGPARRDRGLEGRPAPAHLPADRAHLRPGHRRPGQGRPRRDPLADPRRGSATTCWRPASPASTSRPAGRWRWTGPTWRPSPARRRTAPATAPTPRRPGGTAPAAAPARTASCSSATTSRPPP